MLLPERRLGLFLHTNGGATTLGAAAANALELARGGVPKAPFYLPGSRRCGTVGS